MHVLTIFEAQLLFAMFIYIVMIGMERYRHTLIPFQLRKLETRHILLSHSKYG